MNIAWVSCMTLRAVFHIQGSNLRHVKCATMYIQTSSMLTASWPKRLPLCIDQKSDKMAENLDFTTFFKQQKIRCVILDSQHEFTCSLEDDEQNSLDRHVHGGHVERLEHDVRHALSVGLGVQRSFLEQDVLFPVRNQELVVESVVPVFLHGIPIRDDTVLHWDTSLSRHRACSASRHHHTVFSIHTDHVAWHFGPVNNGTRNRKERSFRDSTETLTNRHSRHTQSSPECPALHMSLPLSETGAATSSSAIYGSIRRLQTKFQRKILLMMSSRHGCGQEDDGI